MGRSCTENFAEAMDWARRAYQRCLENGLSLTVPNFRTALREVGSPFKTESHIEKAYGVKFSKLQRHLLYGYPLETRMPEKQALELAEAFLYDEAEEGSQQDFLLSLQDPRKLEAAWEATKAVTHSARTDAQEKMANHVEIDEGGPIGVIFMGDGHIGAASCNIDRLEWVRDIVHSFPYPLYIINIGDLVHNMHWHPGEMGRGGMSMRKQIQAAAFYLGSIADRMLALVSGNHENWTATKTGVDLLEHVMMVAGKRIAYHHEEMTFDLTVGKVNYRLVLRHAVKGNSQYNPAHGPLRWLMFNDTDYDADLIACGHWHKSGYMSRRIHGRVRHGLQLGAYVCRDADDHCVRGGWENLNESPDMLAIFHDDQKKISVYEDTLDGLRILESLWSPESSSLPLSNPQQTDLPTDVESSS